MSVAARSPSPSDDLQKKVEQVILTLSQTYDDIGYTTHDKEKRKAAVYKALQDCLKEQLMNTNLEKEKIVEECTGLIQQIRQMKKSIDDYDDDQTLRITLPLMRCRQDLRDKLKTTTKMHAKRFEQIKELTSSLRQYSDCLEPSFLRLELPPAEHSKALTFNLSHAYCNALNQEFTRVYEEFQRRTKKVQEVATEIVQLWAELGTHSSQTDKKVLECYKQAPEQLGLRGEDIRGLQSKLRQLREEKDSRDRRIAELNETIMTLWEKLNIDEDYRNHFLATHRSVSQKTILEIEQEAERLQQLKSDNLHIFVEDARQTLQTLWDELYYSEDEMIEFTAAFTTDYTDALLAVHEAEILRLRDLIEERRPILVLIDKHRSLINDQEQLAISATDSSRLTARGGNRDPTRLLREERMRKRIAKELPKVEQDLRVALERYEMESGCPFLVKGEDYLEILLASSSNLTGSISKSSMSRLNSKPSMHALKAAATNQNNASGTQTRAARSQSVREQKSSSRLNGQPVLKHSASAASASNRSTTTSSTAVPLRPKTPTVSRPKTPGLSRPKTPSAQQQVQRRPQTSHAMRPKTPTANASRNGSVSGASNYSTVTKTPARTSRAGSSSGYDNNSPDSNSGHNMNGGMNRSSIASSTGSTNTTAASVATTNTSYSKTGSIRRKMPPPPASSQMIGKLVPTHTGSSNGSGGASPTFSRRPLSYAAPQSRSRGGSIDQGAMMPQGRVSNEGTPSGMPARWHNGAYLRNGASQYRPPSQQSHSSTAYSHDSRSHVNSPHEQQHQRLFSGASSGGESSTTVVSSENWETYDTDGEDDGEGQAGYEYATIRAKQAFAQGLGRSTIASTIAIVGGDHRHASDLDQDWIET